MLRIQISIGSFTYEMEAKTESPMERANLIDKCITMALAAWRAPMGVED